MKEIRFSKLKFPAGISKKLVKKLYVQRKKEIFLEKIREQKGNFIPLFTIPPILSIIQIEGGFYVY